RSEHSASNYSDYQRGHLMNKTKAVRIKKTDNQLVKLTAVNSGTTIRKTLEGMILKSYVKHIEVTK
ncbi:hypothetical protein, partial [Enterobacter hormaechei]|uniref:hypothetical protein n=1 Tax=Enterobacter hormaechei TaxID=158836 RepID=UPI0023E36D24